MRFSNNYIKIYLPGLFLVAAVLSSCEKDGNPNNLPDVNASDYEGKVDGFSSTDEIYPNNLVAYWNFETKNETKTNSAPTSTANDALVDGGIKGKALSLNAGYLYYAKQFDAFKVDAFKNFTISTWVQIANNGSKKTMLFQLARPGMFNGNINFVLETNVLAASSTDIRIHPTFTTLGGGTQDNVNADYTKTPQIGTNKWIHIALSYNSSNGVFNMFANGINVGSFSNRGVGNNVFNSWEPSEVIIGGNYNVIPGKSVSTDTSFAAMTGKLDEIRIYNVTIPDAIIGSIYKLGVAGK